MAGEGHSVQRACRVLRVAESGCYAWRDRPSSPRLVKHAWLKPAVQTLRPGHAQPGGVRTARSNCSVKSAILTPRNSGQARVSINPGAVHRWTDVRTAHTIQNTNEVRRRQRVMRRSGERKHPGGPAHPLGCNRSPPGLLSAAGARRVNQPIREPNSQITPRYRSVPTRRISSRTPRATREVRE